MISLFFFEILRFVFCSSLAADFDLRFDLELNHDYSDFEENDRMVLLEFFFSRQFSNVLNFLERKIWNES